MSLKTLTLFPIFSPPYHRHHYHHHRRSFVIRFSRWNNANAQKFIQRQRTQNEIEEELRFHKRFAALDKIADTQNDAGTTPTPTTTNDTFKSTGTPSAPSLPSIPGRRSKYSKPPKPPKPLHPALIIRVPNITKEQEHKVKLSAKGLTYVIPEAPFEYQYSYTETPKAKPVKLREPPVTPFGPSTMPRPWTGRKPLPPSKKQIDFDSFKLPPPLKKGVKPVQRPGPFLPGSGPKYVHSREEIMGEPLSKEEVDELVKGCLKSKRQLNMGRDGLTHNMLDNIHALWKRRRVCKIRCKGVCTVDMDNVCHQLEDKTGGKIIYSKGGIIYLFRGRNYNYKTRPRFPLMLWKPAPPVYPKLIKKTPEGLTAEEASEMRMKGRKLIPICKLAKNGVYHDLVTNVREAFEACELVRIDCQGLNPSDYKKIGAKLMDLVPCVLISFEYEHILMWRGRDWKSSLPPIDDDPEEVKEPKINGESSISPPLEGEEPSISRLESATFDNLNTSTSPVGIEKADDLPYIVNKSNSNGDYFDLDDTKAMSVKFDAINQAGHQSPGPQILNEMQVVSQNSTYITETVDLNSSPNLTNISETVDLNSSPNSTNITATVDLNSSPNLTNITETVDLNSSPNSANITEKVNLNSSPWTAGVLTLLERAVEGGSAVVLDESCLDPDIVYQRAVSLAKSAPPGPVFRHRRPKKVAVEIVEKQEGGDLERKEVFNQKGGDLEGKEVSNQEGGELEGKVIRVLERRVERKRRQPRRENTKVEIINVVPQGTLRVDELAKLLA